MENLLTLENVRLVYQTKVNETVAIDGLTFNVKEGNFVAIIGPSGCGKTSILSLVSGLIEKTDGTVTFDGKLVEKPDDNIGYMLQKDHLFEWLTIENNILLPLKIKKKLNDNTKAYVNRLIEKYGLSEFKKYYPNQLSGGMRQRVALIRTLSSSPKLLLLDEPFSALDYQTRLLVCNDVHKIIKSEKKTALLVTHDITEAISLADEIIVLTKRPAKLKNQYKIDFPPELSPLKRREQHTFGVWFEKLWEELNDG